MADDDVFVHTKDGTYKIPAADLERYRTEEEPAEVEGFAFDAFNVDNLRSSQDLKVQVGEQPVIRQGGHVIFSTETIVTNW
ncbi:MAG: hypothetical protein ACLFRV_11210 [Acidimicrobiales bacterium]